MNTIEINALPFVDFNVNGIISMEQAWTDGAEFAYSNSVRPDHGFNLVTEGKIVYTDDKGNMTEACKGCITYLPKGQQYKADFFADKGQQVKCILINFMLTDASGTQLSLSSSIKNLFIDGDGLLFKDFRIISAMYKTSTDKLRIKTAFLSMLQKLIPEFKENGGAFTVGKCAEFINRNCSLQISVPELAKMCCLSETTFRKRFKEMYGMTPTQYITERKLHMACDMLISSDITIAEISDLLGFYDTAYFCKTMKQYVHVTPAEYRARHRVDS